MSDRIEPFHPEALEAEAKAVYDRIMADRGSLPGPYLFWLSSPGYADRMERVEEHLRFHISLDQRAIEVVVLTCARHWKAAYVWTAHVPQALAASVEDTAVEAILNGDRPQFERDCDAVCYALCATLLPGGDITDDLWQQAHAVIGESGINEVVGLIGLYTSVCLTMVSYRKPTKNGEPQPFELPGEVGGQSR